jgi:hypothetical protein
MYSGRDGQSVEEVKGDFEQRGEDRDGCIRTILEKRMNLRAYLERGMEIARKGGMDLD